MSDGGAQGEAQAGSCEGRRSEDLGLVVEGEICGEGQAEVDRVPD